MASASSALPPLRRTALIRLLFLAACVVVRGGGDDALVGTVNDLYIQARTFEDGSQMLLAMRTLTAAARLLPRDARVMKKLRSVHRDVAAFVPVPYEGATLTMPVWIPKTPGVPSEPGSADGMVAEFFKWKRIPIFRNDSAHCAVHKHERLTIMGQTCLSSLYVSTHNAVHSIIRGESVDAAKTSIPTSSRVRCGARCGVSIPQRTLAPFPRRNRSHDELLWQGTGPAGENLTIYRGETRDAAMQRLVQTNAVTRDRQRKAAEALRQGIIEMLLPKRATMLHSLKPFVHRSQVFGDELHNTREDALTARSAEPVFAATRFQPVAMTSPSGGKVPMVWDMLENHVAPTGEASEAGEEQPWAHHSTGSDEAAAARFLWLHQHPADCSKRNALVYMHDRAYWGFAANVHFMTVAFNYALAFNRTFLAMESDHWNYGGRDCRYGWHCYFQPLSRCSERDVWEPYTVPIRLDHWWDHRGYLYRIDTEDARTLHYGNVDGPWQEVIGNRRGPHGGPVRQWIPELFRHKGLLWWRAQLTRYLMRPKGWVLGYINQRRHALSLPASPLAASGVIGLHVRRGDKSYDQYQGSFFGSIDSYISKARLLNPQATTLFVSTDDPAVIDGIPLTAQRHKLHIIYDDLEPRFNGTHIYAPPGISLARWPAFPGNDPNVNTTLYALETIKSIWLLAFACEDFVGTVTSSMSRLIYQLRVAFGQRQLTDEWTLDQDARHPPGWFADP